MGPRVSALRPLSAELAIVPAAKDDNCADRADQRTPHILLRVPDVALPAEKRVGVAAVEHRGDPLDQFVSGADRHRYADNEEARPRARRNDLATNDDFARN